MTISHKETILIVDDSEMNRMILSNMLDDNYNILEATDGIEAMEMIENHFSTISIVLLDLVMPKADGFEVLSYMKHYSITERIPVVMITSENSPELIKKAYELGATDFISRPFDMDIVKRRVSNTILLYAKQRKLSSIIARQITEKEKTKNLMVGILSHIVEFRNGESGLHVLHISKLTEVLLRKIIFLHNEYSYLLPDINLISNAAALHDIGKIVIPEDILNKPGKLTKEEFEVIKTHSEIGANIIKSMAVNQDEPMLKYAYEICRWHHERWDGSGYPDKLKGDQIPLSAQIVSLVDVYDALTSKRCYKAAFSHEKAMDIILNEEKGKYNPMIIEAFLKSTNEVRKVVSSKTLFKDDLNDDITIDFKAEFDKVDSTDIYNKGFEAINIEREKSLFAALSQEEAIFMSYRIEKNILSCTTLNKEAYGLSNLIINPKEDPALINILGKDFFNKLCLEGLKHKDNDANFNFTHPITFNGITKNEVIKCKSIWGIKNSDTLNNILFRIIKF